ncbi:hypothetical protein [uncultured Sphingomonas sp.]|uniref:hypothetical protein n=1 Tax=uncultured Sphingomonas sp. TaxID=158754 RepID=UPI0025FD4B9D|nr:hypothetical protein [uncultured Sphingomonas sp.]
MIALIVVATAALVLGATYGDIVHVRSTYESRHAAGEAPFARGMNAIQLVRTSAGWRVPRIVWQGETPTLPIPGGYLPKTDKR